MFDDAEIFMVHYMKLGEKPFTAVRSGNKKIEMRLYDEKRRKLSVNDTVVFTSVENGGQITAEIKALHVFDSFMQMYGAFSAIDLGYSECDAKNASYTDMYEYYSVEDERKYGVVGIEISLKKDL